MAEVVRMGKRLESLHLDKLLKRLERAQTTKARTIADNADHIIMSLADTIHRDALDAYNFFKKEYSR